MTEQRIGNAELSIGLEYRDKDLSSFALLGGFAQTRADDLDLELRQAVVLRPVDLIERDGGGRIDMDAIDLDDAPTYQMLARGDALGVFQFESSGMREALREVRPTEFADLIALVALYRPGPLGGGLVDDFIKRRQGRVKVQYPHPLLEEILRETYGV